MHTGGAGVRLLVNRRWGGGAETSAFARKAKRSTGPQEAHVLDGVGARCTIRTTSGSAFLHNPDIVVFPDLGEFLGARSRDLLWRAAPSRPVFVEICARRSHLATSLAPGVLKGWAVALLAKVCNTEPNDRPARLQAEAPPPPSPWMH